jgi:hypothetical protein
MSHFAKVTDGKVTQVIVAEKEFFDTYVDSTPGEWIQTSYNTQGGKHLLGGTPLRGNYAGIGYTYDQCLALWHLVCLRFHKMFVQCPLVQRVI